MFFRNRTLPPTPISLVKLSASERLVDDGLVELHAHQGPGAGADVAPVVSPSAGTAATAAAVSWLAVAKTGA